MKITDSRFLITFALLLISWAFVYQGALLGMEAIWSRSDTFAHGYFILPISIWLVWRDKKHLLSSYVQSTWLPLPILFISLFVWLLAYAADINVLGQLSAVISLIALIWSMIGNKLAWRYKFPLAYLLFAVPMGENLIPMLQDVTAWFTVNLLKLNGIPVFRDGLYIQVPTGLFEVAVACSGIRYLIASIAVGTLFAYLTYTSTKKQVIFILFSIVMPIVANGVRAYGIVAIAYYSDMKYATGVDHLIYGWLFFGLVIMLMFWIGGLFADKEKNDLNDNLVSTEVDSLTNLQRYIKAPSVALLMLISVSVIFNSFSVISTPETPNVALIQNENFKEIKNSNWGVTFIDGLKRSHLINNQRVEFFRAVYGNKQTQGELISFENTLHNHDTWTVIETKQQFINDFPVEIVHLRNIQGSSRSYLYQYKSGNYSDISIAKIKLSQAVNSLFKLYNTSEIIAVSIEGNTDLVDVEGKLLAIFTQISELKI